MTLGKYSQKNKYVKGLIPPTHSPLHRLYTRINSSDPRANPVMTLRRFQEKLNCVGPATKLIRSTLDDDDVNVNMYTYMFITSNSVTKTLQIPS